jgi:A/G-specific adenine glycosylase
VQSEVIEWFAKNGRDLPWRHDDFSPWGALVSEFMLQQTPVARVIPRLTEWLDRWPTPSALAHASPADAVRAWQNLGYPRRALWLHACATAIVAQHDGEVPSDVDALLRLPGVGPYTARAVAVFAFRAHEPVVDTNIRRVIARAVHGESDQGPPSTTRDLADMTALLPPPDVSPEFNAGMMELGAIVCTARNPACDICPLRESCAWRAAGYPTSNSPRRRPQAKYEGSDRQARGAVLKALRERPEPVSRASLAAVWADSVQLDRAILTLLDDGLVVATGIGDRAALSLPLD